MAEMGKKEATGPAIKEITLKTMGIKPAILEITVPTAVMVERES